MNVICPYSATALCKTSKLEAHLQAILDLGHEGALRYERKQLPLDIEREWYDEGHEHCHLEDEQCKDLC